MDPKHIKINSSKYGVEGEVIDCGIAVRLSFQYDGREIEMGLSPGFGFFENCEETASAIIDDYIDKLSPKEECKTMLYYWYMEEYERDDEAYTIMHGIVSGHKWLMDSIFVNTSPIKSYALNYDDEELLVITKNTIYHCPLAYCKFEKQDLVKNQIPDYESIKKKYRDKAEQGKPTIDDGKVLLVISNHNEYYFHSLYYRPVDAEKPIEYHAFPHIGTLQDSFLIHGKGIKLAYFPHYQSIEFYGEVTSDMPFYIENVGDIVLYCNTSCGLLKLNPKERKRVSEENAETEEITLPGGDLYPAQILTDDDE